MTLRSGGDKPSFCRFTIPLRKQCPPILKLESWFSRLRLYSGSAGRKRRGNINLPFKRKAACDSRTLFVVGMRRRRITQKRRL
ncbi:hypothetical protein [Epibacterium ulvae]|uniref:hypothetical protein n=1 Tax=Epibacterium ulvae TaxID=1156985 RepID=UPI002491C272|nr:hypothetical protein [Epibacterium ulvae]